jgi:hypothetical protein
MTELAMLNEETKPELLPKIAGAPSAHTDPTASFDTKCFRVGGGAIDSIKLINSFSCQFQGYSKQEFLDNISKYLTNKGS